MENHSPPSDEWSRWLLHVRHGGDPALQRANREELESLANRVLDGARLEPGMTLADIGSGEGLVAFRAIERVGPALRVILTDVSAPMLRHAQALATERGIQGQCSFVECAADNLAGLQGASVDAVTTRAVLAYVADKAAALREFRRVLKPGGRLSLAEPIFQDDAFVACALKKQVDAPEQGNPDPLRPLLHRWKAAQFPDTLEKVSASPLTNYSERTLFDLARASGFEQVHVQLHMDLAPSKLQTWEVFLETSPHPWAPPLSKILAEQFTAAERALFEQSMRPLVESGRASSVARTAYLHAVK
jgi:ubiquinone/menaquinone biosynthesis C-methylase UbiE